MGLGGGAAGDANPKAGKRIKPATDKRDKRLHFMNLPPMDVGGVGLSKQTCFVT